MRPESEDGMRMTWTSNDQAAAERQGWGIYAADFLGGHVRVRRPTSENQRFDTDMAAAAYVVGRADCGCRLATKALRNISAAYRTVGAIGDCNKLVA